MRKKIGSKGSIIHHILVSKEGGRKKLWCDMLPAPPAAYATIWHFDWKLGYSRRIVDVIRNSCRRQWIAPGGSYSATRGLSPRATGNCSRTSWMSMKMDMIDVHVIHYRAPCILSISKPGSGLFSPFMYCRESCVPMATVPWCNG